MGKVLLVSIPYSSGQCFFFTAHLPLIPEFPPCFNPLFIRSVFLFYTILFWEKGKWHKFQSLIHQVSVSFNQRIKQVCRNPELFQSLIHQVSVSFTSGSNPCLNSRTCFNPLFIRSVFLLRNEKWQSVLSCMFQSLIHQVSVSFTFFSLIGYTVSATQFQSLIHQVSVSFNRGS